MRMPESMIAQQVRTACGVESGVNNERNSAVVLTTAIAPLPAGSLRENEQTNPIRRNPMRPFIVQRFFIRWPTRDAEGVTGGFIFLCGQNPFLTTISVVGPPRRIPVCRHDMANEDIRHARKYGADVDPPRRAARVVARHAYCKCLRFE